MESSKGKDSEPVRKLPKVVRYKITIQKAIMLYASAIIKQEIYSKIYKTYRNKLLKSLKTCVQKTII